MRNSSIDTSDWKAIAMKENWEKKKKQHVIWWRLRKENISKEMFIQLCWMLLRCQTNLLNMQRNNFNIKITDYFVYIRDKDLYNLPPCIMPRIKTKGDLKY